MGIVTDVVLPLALAFIMFALGLGLTFGDFARVAKQPRDFLVGAASQIILLPVVAFALVSIWPLQPELALGVMIIAAAPGGVTSNLLTAYARGDVALSISLTAVISLLSVVTIPIVVVLSYAYLMDDGGKEVSVAQTAISVFVIVTVPVVIGLLVRRFAEGFALRFEPIARHVSTGLFVLVLAGAIFQERNNIVTYFAQGRIGDADAQRDDDGAGLLCGQAVRRRTGAAGGHLHRVRPAERYAGHCGRHLAVRRRPRGGAGRHLQPDHVRNGVDLHRLFAPRPPAGPERFPVKLIQFGREPL